jgi:hypothetical protein
MPAKKEMTANAKKAIKSVRPISIDTPANPVAPNIIAMSPRMKNTSAARNIQISFNHESMVAFD